MCSEAGKEAIVHFLYVLYIGIGVGEVWVEVTPPRAESLCSQGLADTHPASSLPPCCPPACSIWICMRRGYRICALGTETTSAPTFPISIPAPPGTTGALEMCRSGPSHHQNPRLGMLNVLLLKAEPVAFDFPLSDAASLHGLALKCCKFPHPLQKNNKLTGWPSPCCSPHPTAPSTSCSWPQRCRQPTADFEEAAF